MRKHSRYSERLVEKLVLRVLRNAPATAYEISASAVSVNYVQTVLKQLAARDLVQVVGKRDEGGRGGVESNVWGLKS